MSIGIWQVVLILAHRADHLRRGQAASGDGRLAKGVKSFKAGLKDDEPAAQQAESRTTLAGGCRPGGQEGRARERLSPRTLFGVRSMFDIGWSEMALILMVALIVIGPKDLPRVARTIGKWTGKARGDGARVPALARRHGARGRAAGHQGRDGQAQPGRRPPPLEETIDPEGELRRSLAAPVGCRIRRARTIRPMRPTVPSAARRAVPSEPPDDPPRPAVRTRRNRRRPARPAPGAAPRTADAAHQGHRRARDAAARPSARAAQPA